jgi:hypothetical protein
MKSNSYQVAGTFTVTTTGVINDLDFENCSVIRMENATLATITGLKAGYPGQRVAIMAVQPGPVDLSHEDTGSLAQDRLLNTITGNPTRLVGNFGIADYQYDDVTVRWRLIASLSAQIFGRSEAQTAAVAVVATYTVADADASFVVSANVQVTTATLHNFAVQVDYTDETNTPRTLTLNVSQLTGAFVTAITNVTGAGPYEGVPLHLRCKEATAITVKTAGTFTTVTYNVEAAIQKIA